MRRMRHFSSINENEASIDMSPLIDVVFILLIFFIVTTVFNNEAGVDVAKPPKMASSKSLDSNAIIMAVTNNGQVYYAGRNIGINGVAGACLLYSFPRPRTRQKSRMSSSSCTQKSISGRFPYISDNFPAAS